VTTRRGARRVFGRAENAMNEVDYAALEAMHDVEDRMDHATGGRFYDSVEKADEEAGELLDRLHLDNELGEHEGETPPDASTGSRPPAA
jgi:hypothetical protein